MHEIAAFVGHSFTVEDRDLVRAFLDYLDVVTNMDIGFSWQHAEPAEPKELSEKVLSLMKDKNLFVGICTNKEQAIEPKMLKRFPLWRNLLTAKQTDFARKTSDWIIQEIGVAIGLGMALILLTEEGLRIPGGLQGNVEYIPFMRESPERSFKKLLEMIQSLRPKAMEKGGGIETQIGPPASAIIAAESAEDEFRPSASWTRAEYEFALMYMIFTGDSKREQDIFDFYLTTENGAKPANIESWQACREFYRLEAGKGDLRTLEKYARTHHENGEVQKFLAKSYEHYSEFAKAGQQYQHAADVSSDNAHKLARLKDAAIAYMQAGMEGKAAEIIENMRKAAKNDENNAVLLLIALQETAKLANDKDIMFGSSECLLEFRPDDIDVRFNLAYNYSQENLNQLSLFHYVRIPIRQRKQFAWNNLGVAYEHFKIAGKAVESYRKSENLGETLAMSNLAKRLINGGFLPEANEICQKAIKIENYHQNIPADILRIKELPNEEDKKEEEIVKKGKILSEFYRDFGHALIEPVIKDHVGRWQGPDCELSVKVEGRTFTAEGQYSLSQEKTFRGLNQLAIPVLGGLGAQTETNIVVNYRVKYEGQISGRAIKSRVTRDKDSVPTSLLSMIGSETSHAALMIISESSGEIKVFEKTDSDTPKFYTLVGLNRQA